MPGVQPIVLQSKDFVPSPTGRGFCSQNYWPHPDARGAAKSFANGTLARRARVPFQPDCKTMGRTRGCPRHKKRTPDSPCGSSGVSLPYCRDLHPCAGLQHALLAKLGLDLQRFDIATIGRSALIIAPSGAGVKRVCPPNYPPAYPPRRCITRRGGPHLRAAAGGDQVDSSPLRVALFPPFAPTLLFSPVCEPGSACIARRLTKIRSPHIMPSI